MAGGTVFDLQGKVTLDTSDVPGKLKKVSTALKKGLASAAKISATALTAAATAVSFLAKSTVSAYAEFEQLEGGAKKIFDKMDYSVIAADAQSAYKNMNLSASEYLSMINQVGATFAATMGDKKGYETAKIGMQAIADYASGTGRSVSELNNKFALITRSTSSYQSIADQFSGILPATSKDFLKQAQKAGYLSKKYKDLTKVPLKEYQKALSKMLKKGVKDMGLAGNTAAESEKTITGSLAATKAAWKDLLVALGSGDGIKEAITKLVDSAKNLATNLKPVLKNALVGIAQLVEELGPILIEYIPELVADLLPALLDAASALLKAVVKALPGLLKSLLTVFKKFMITLKKWLLKNAPELGQAFVKFYLAVKKAFVKIKKAWNTTLKPALIEIGTKIKSYVGPAIETLSGVIEKLSGWFKSAATKIKEFVVWLNSGDEKAQRFKSVIQYIVTAFVAYIAIMKTVKTVMLAVQVAQTLLNAAMSANTLSLIVIALAAVAAGFVTLWNKSESFRNFWKGVWETISSKVESAKEKITTAWQAIKDYVQNDLAPAVKEAWEENMKPAIDTVKWSIIRVKTAFERIKAALEPISGKFDDIKTAITEYVTSGELGADITNTVKKAILFLANALSKVATWIANVITKIADIIEWFTSFDTAGQALKTAVLIVWNTIKMGIIRRVNAIRDRVSSAWETLKTNVSTAIDNIKTEAETKWEEVKSAVLGKIQNMRTQIILKFLQIKAKIKQTWEKIKSTITKPIEDAKDTIKGIVDQIKGFFTDAIKLDFKLPTITMGKKTWNTFAGTIEIPWPEIKWNKKAYMNPYMFTKPTVMAGFGDGAGGEIVYGHSALMRDIKNAVGGGVSSAEVTINVYAQPNQSAAEIAQMVQKEFIRWDRQRRAAYA